MSSIVVAVGEPTASEHLLDLAASLARERNAELVLAHARVHAIEPSQEKQLAKLEAGLKADGLNVSSVIEDALMGGEAEFIAKTARERQAQMIVMGSRGRTPLAGALLGSTSQDILHETPCPVVIIPEHKTS